MKKTSVKNDFHKKKLWRKNRQKVYMYVEQFIMLRKQRLNIKEKTMRSHITAILQRYKINYGMKWNTPEECNKHALSVFKSYSHMKKITRKITTKSKLPRQDHRKILGLSQSRKF